MTKKEQVVTEMCESYRSDYHINKDPNGPPWLLGLTPFERRGLRLSMSALYDTIIQLKKEHDELERPTNKNHHRRKRKVDQR
jgi:hypothetical protein